MSRKKKIVTHFTTHACLVADPDAKTRSTSTDRAAWYADSKYRNASVHHGCWLDRRRRMNPERDRYTALIDDVTCSECRDRYEEQLADFARNAYPDGSGAGRAVGEIEDAIWIVWRACCHHTSARPLLPEDAVLARQQNDVANLVWENLDARRIGSRGLRPRDLTRLFDCIPEELREPLRPAIDELTMACDLLQEAERMVARAGVFVEGIVDEINNGVMVVDCDAVRNHIEEATERHSKERAKRLPDDIAQAVLS